MTAILFSVVLAFVPGQTGAKEQSITKVVSQKIPFRTVYRTSPDLKAGQVKSLQKGVDGKIDTTYKIILNNDKVVSKKALFSIRTEPTSAITVIGKTSRSNKLASRGNYVRGEGEVLTMVATGYDTSQATIPGGTGRTATGIRATYGVCAVDPRYIRLGTIVYIEGYGEAICADTGGAIKGMRIDLCFDSRREALDWGRRTVKVHILGR
ncbi:MAG: 3D domain-containing protein [Fimbriimonadaceae bacterium]